jgi:CRISPR-associated exonuclease Cas4
MQEAEKTFGEDDYLPLSALQHFIFCPRQCALIHIEYAWAENRLTAEGKHFHDRVHEAGDESRGDIRFVRGLTLRSTRFGLIGKADLVEFHRRPNRTWQPYPVEFKRGRSKLGDCDRIQLCAQAVCLEEMLNTDVPEGALYYRQPKRREPIILDSLLRSSFESAVAGLRQLIRSQQTPAPQFEKKCSACSLIDVCGPRFSKVSHSAINYLDREVDSS